MSKTLIRFAAWLGFLATLSHAVVPLVVMSSAQRTPRAAHAPTHAAQAHGARHNGHVTPIHTHDGHGAHGAPAAPDTLCVGDCPCCTTKFHASLPSRLHATSLSALRDGAPAALPASFHSLPPLHDHAARAPPAATWL